MYDIKKRKCGEGNRKRGMTLLEILGATAVISFLMSMLALVGMNPLERARVRAAKADIASFGVALRIAYEDTGVFPSELLDITSADPPTGVSGTNWHGPYAKYVPLQDPWGNDYFLLFDVTNSFGPSVFERTEVPHYDETFNFSAEEGLGTLNIINNGVASARIWINGEKICSINDFQISIPTISREVDIQESNTIRIWIADTPGPSFNLTVTSKVVSGVTYHLGSFGKDGLLGGNGINADIEYSQFNEP